jgi:hypothetical protein
MEFLNPLHSLQYFENNGITKGGMPISEYFDGLNLQNAISSDEQGITQNKTGIIIKGGKHDNDSVFVPLGLVYIPPSLCDYDKQEEPEDIQVISDKRFESLFSLVSAIKTHRNSQKKQEYISKKSKKTKRNKK